MFLYLVHHADAVGAHVDPRRPLSTVGLEQAEQLASMAKVRGCAPGAIWHSGKLRARQTAEIFYRLCSPFAEFKMIRGLLPDDPAQYLRALLLEESRDVLAAGHMPNVWTVLRALDPAAADFPVHGMVALETADDGLTWSERWRASPK